jgi:hypothetical protein
VSLDETEKRLASLLAPVEGAPAYEPARRDRTAATGAPKGWQAGVEFVSTTERIVTTGPIPGDLRDEAGWREILETMQGPLPDGWVIELREASFDPAAWTRDVAFDDEGKKTPAVTRPAWRYRFRTRFDPQMATRVDVDELIAEIRRHRPRKRPAAVGGGAFNALLTDWQFGKVEGDGIKGTIERVDAMILAVEARILELRRAGRDLDELVVYLGGDMVEGCDGFYAMQTFTVGLDRRDQVKAARRLLRDALIRWSRLFDRVTVTGVGGNHGENRKDGKAFTTFADNDDVAILEQTAEIMSAGSAYEHVRFIIPTDHLAITVPVAGHVVGLTHGHLARVTGATPEAKLHRWYEQQAGGKLPIGDADVLLTAHYHSFAVADWGGAWWIQGGTLDGGSRWFTDSTGRYSKPGTVTFTLTPGQAPRDIELV